MAALGEGGAAHGGGFPAPSSDWHVAALGSRCVCTCRLRSCPSCWVWWPASPPSSWWSCALSPAMTTSWRRFVRSWCPVWCRVVVSCVVPCLLSCAVGPVRWVLCGGSCVLSCCVPSGPWVGYLQGSLCDCTCLCHRPPPPPPSHTPLHLHAPSVQVIGRYRVPNPAGCPAPHDTPHRFVSWGEAQTMIYLKISLSDFFTVFAARCRSWCVAHARPHTHADAHTGIPHVAT
jgi:hypothetical protein